jgi:hypothetical protein
MSHRGTPLRNPSVTYGSARPLVAAVLCSRSWLADPKACHCGSTCACPKIESWFVSRTSYTRLAAETYMDQLRGQGCRACVVPMMLVRAEIRGANG